MYFKKRHVNKDEMKSRAIFIEFRMCDFHRGKNSLNMIVGSESEATGPEQQQIHNNLYSEIKCYMIQNFATAI